MHAVMYLFLIPDRTGKRYRTKKERLRVEKEGPPYCTDGSLDYTESKHTASHFVYFIHFFFFQLKIHSPSCPFSCQILLPDHN